MDLIDCDTVEKLVSAICTRLSLPLEILNDTRTEVWDSHFKDWVVLDDIRLQLSGDSKLRLIRHSSKMPSSNVHHSNEGFAGAEMNQDKLELQSDEGFAGAEMNQDKLELQPEVFERDLSPIRMPREPKIQYPLRNDENGNESQESISTLRDLIVQNASSLMVDNIEKIKVDIENLVESQFSAFRYRMSSSSAKEGTKRGLSALRASVFKDGQRPWETNNDVFSPSLSDIVGTAMSNDIVGTAMVNDIVSTALSNKAESQNRTKRTNRTRYLLKSAMLMNVAPRASR